MKKRICLALCGIGMILSLTGCGQKVENVEGEIVDQIGQFIVLQDNGFVHGCSTYHQYLVYDKDTYVIYIYQNGSFSPYYCINADGQPEIAIYHD